MKLLIIGSGGREHVLAWKLSQSKRVGQIYCAPGNGGIEAYATCVNISADDLNGLVDFAEKEKIDLTVVGPDDPLVAGVVDVFEDRGLRIFGPRKNAAILEGSKAFSKDLMLKYQIPCADSTTFDSLEDAIEYLKKGTFPIVLKADGLALGKGVLICNDLEEAIAGAKAIMEEKKFGAAGNRMVIETFMTGREVSVQAFCDGKSILPMTSAQDHKRAKNGDQGLNTGGMGTFSPSPFYTEEIADYCMKHIFQPTIDAMRKENRPYVGILFVGLMLTPAGPKVVEYNARLGDPETQVVLPRMKNDLLDVIEACIDGRLDEIQLEFEDNAAVCVILASEGYPEAYQKGFPISGLENFINQPDYYAFHAGTQKDNNVILTAGGRVLGITAKGNNLKEARAKAYEASNWVNFENLYKRDDIGKAIEEAE